MLRVIYDILYIKKSFLLFSEVLLNLIIDSLILVINAICLGKAILFGDYLYLGGLVEEENKEFQVPLGSGPLLCKGKENALFEAGSKS